MQQFTSNADNRPDKKEPTISNHCNLPQNDAVLIGSMEEQMEEPGKSSTSISISKNEIAKSGLNKRKRSASRKVAGKQYSFEHATQPPPQELCKISHAAVMLSISTVSVRRLIERGYFTPIRVLRHQLLRVRELRDFVEQGANSSASPTGKNPNSRSQGKTKKESQQP